MCFLLFFYFFILPVIEQHEFRKEVANGFSKAFSTGTHSKSSNRSEVMERNGNPIGTGIKLISTLLFAILDFFYVRSVPPRLKCANTPLLRSHAFSA